MSGPKFFGYWMPVADEAGARDAVRMSGLPVLLMGANAALLALVASAQPVPDPVVIASSATIAALLILLAFRIRAGHAAWIPFALMLFAAFSGANLLFSYIGWRVAGKTPAASAQLLLGWVVPALCLILVAGGFRGWLWMRANKARLSF